MDNNYVYILKLAMDSDRSVYKIGKTTRNIETRFKEYPPDTEMIKYFKCFDCTSTEKQILRVFKKKFYIYRGHEYFEGNESFMVSTMSAIVKSQNEEWKEKMI